MRERKAPEAELQELVQKTLASQMLLRDADPRAHLLAAKVVDALKSPSHGVGPIGGWLIAQGKVYERVVEVDWNDGNADGQNTTVYLEPSYDDEEKY